MDCVGGWCGCFGDLGGGGLDVCCFCVCWYVCGYGVGVVCVVCCVVGLCY